MATPLHIHTGEVAVVSVFEDSVEKRFIGKNKAYDGMYEAEVEGLRRCEKFDFVPRILANDTATKTITMSRVGRCDALDWMLIYGNNRAATSRSMKHVALTVRKLLLQLHEDGMSHRDEKLENLTFDFENDDPYNISHVYLIDFATSTTAKYGTTKVFSDSFSSPEAKNVSYRLSKRDDIWGFLACLYVWVSGGHPMFVRYDDWEGHFMRWYNNADPAFWLGVVDFGTLSVKTALVFNRKFTALKDVEDEGSFPTEEEIESLFCD